MEKTKYGFLLLFLLAAFSLTGCKGGQVTESAVDTVGETTEDGAQTRSETSEVEKTTAEETEAETEAETETEATPENFYRAGTNKSAAEVEKRAEEIRQHFLDHDWEAVSEDLSYPIGIDDRNYQNAEEFLAEDWETLANPTFFVEMKEETCRQMFCNWQGVSMGGSGQIWMNDKDGELKIFRINSLTEEAGLPSQVGARMKDNSLTRSGMTLVLYNESDLQVTAGDDYRLKKKTGDTWTELEPWQVVVCHDIAYTPERGKPVEWTVDWSSSYGELAPGMYSLKKLMRAEDGGDYAVEGERGVLFDLLPPLVEEALVRFDDSVQETQDPPKETIAAMQGTEDMYGGTPGTFYTIQENGVVRFYFQAEGKDQITQTAYAVTGEEHALANGIHVGMTREQVREILPNLYSFTWKEDEDSLWNVGSYPEGWCQQFPEILIARVDYDQELPLYIGFMMDDQGMLKAMTYCYPTAG